MQALGGVEGYHDHGHVNNPTLVGFQTLLRDRLDLYVGNVAGYMQLIWPNFIVTATAGGRVERNSLFGASFLPRVALTRAFRRVHAKQLFSQAFARPVSSTSTSTGHPARAHQRPRGRAGVEAERPCAAWHQRLLGAVAPPHHLRHQSAVGAEEHFNSDSTSSVGVEADFRIKYSRFSINPNYSFYSAANQNLAPVYSVPGRDDLLLGMAAHKLALLASSRLYRDRLFLNPTATLLSERYTYVALDDAGEPVLGSEPPVLLWNVFLVYRNLGLRGFDLGIGATNLLGQPFRCVQTYKSGHPPLRGASHEFFHSAEL